MKVFLKIILGTWLVYLLSWMLADLTGINKLAIKSEDTLPTMFLPLSIIKKGNLYLDDYYPMLVSRYPHPDDKSYLRGLTPFYLKKVGNHYLSAFPIMTAVVAAPIYFLPVIVGMPATWENVIFLSHLSSSLIVALAGYFLYRLLKKHTSLPEHQALLVTGIYLFGTINYALISQSMWQHGTVQLFLLLAIYFFMEALQKPSACNYFISGLTGGLAILSRPTAVLAFLLLFLLLTVRNRVTKIEFIKLNSILAFGFALCALFFLWYNQTYYLDISNQGYSSQLLTSWQSPFPISLIGVWLSPSKGILVYSPIFIFSLIGFVLSFKKRDTVYLTFGLIFFLHTLAISLWKHWYGGWSFGYRMSSDVLPFIVLLLVPFLESPLYNKLKSWFIAALVVSVSIQVLGIIFFDGIWHAAYDLGYKNTSWLWSVRDSETLFNVRRVLVKLGLLAHACPKCL
jgi:hypothetical protein